MFNQITDPLFALGYGLSNSGCELNEIQYSNLKVTKVNTKSIQPDDSIVFTVSIDAINNCAAKANITDVVQIYLIDPPMLNMDSSMPILVRYWKRLIGFKKIVLEPNKQATINVDIRFDNVAIYIDAAFEKFELVKGKYTVRVGNSSRTDSMSVDVTI